MNTRATVVVLALLAVLLAGTGLAQDTVGGDDDGFRSPAGVTKLPFEMVRGHMVLEVEVNGVDLRLAIDNGVLSDSLLLYGGPRIDTLNLEFSGKQRFGEEGQANSFLADVASGLTLRIGGTELRDQSAHVVPASTNMWKLFTGEDGVISGTLFSRFVVQIDFEETVVVLIEPDDFEPAGSGRELEMISFEDLAYTLPCTLTMPDGRTVSWNPILDLGSHLPLLLFLGAREDVSVPPGAIATQVAIGWSGHKATIPKVRIGDYTLKDVPVAFTKESARISENCEGLIGPQFLARFLVTFDHGKKRLFLKPNSRFDDPF
jgi:hypothetical protein